MVEIMPRNMLVHDRATKAELGVSKSRENKYIKGVIAQLNPDKKNKNKIIEACTSQSIS